MTDYWIVTDNRFHRHRSLEDAERESKRLKTGRAFTVHRMKSNLQNRSTEIIANLRARLTKYEPEALEAQELGGSEDVKGQSMETIMSSGHTKKEICSAVI